MSAHAIETVNLGRTFHRSATEAKGAPTIVALSDVNLTVGPGELFGLLGPNGAGKTSLIKILTTLLAPSSGSARVGGFDVVHEAQEVRRRINMVSGGENTGYGLLTVRENLWLFSQLYGVPSAAALGRIDAILKVADLTEKAHTKINRLSTGQRQRMNFCRGFITDPQILFLDEPTLGLDITVARNLRKFVRSWLGEQPGRTILLTTHYMQEADELCDRLAIIDHGKVLACDSPAALKRRLHRHVRFEILVAGNSRPSPDLSSLQGVGDSLAETRDDGVLLKLALEEEPAIGRVVQKLLADNWHILTLTKVEPTLEDVFVQIVGHGLSSEAPQ